MAYKISRSLAEKNPYIALTAWRFSKLDWPFDVQVWILYALEKTIRLIYHSSWNIITTKFNNVWLIFDRPNRDSTVVSS